MLNVILLLGRPSEFFYHTASRFDGVNELNFDDAGGLASIMNRSESSHDLESLHAERFMKKLRERVQADRDSAAGIVVQRDDAILRPPAI